jgi:hypothetical protein
MCGWMGWSKSEVGVWFGIRVRGPSSQCLDGQRGYIVFRHIRVSFCMHHDFVAVVSESRKELDISAVCCTLYPDFPPEHAGSSEMQLDPVSTDSSHRDV